MKEIWQMKFPPSYIRPDGVIVLNDGTIPLPPNFTPNPDLRSTVVFPPNSRAGDHFHQERQELFVGFGKGMQLVIENPETKQPQIFFMDSSEIDSSENDRLCVAFLVPAGVPHTVRNLGPDRGFLIELADRPQEKVDYKINA